MSLSISSYCSREIHCSCGRVHFCPIEAVVTGVGVLPRLRELTERFGHIALIADENTYAACGEAVRAQLGDRLERLHIFRAPGHLVPDERAVSELESVLTPQTDFILGVGSGVINDLCKYVSWNRGLECGIAATAPSMDGYASSGAAMITNGMKVTYTTHPPRFIVADTDVIRQAPIDMIRAGYGDIIGKYSALNDWQLARLITGEYFCQEIYDLVMEATDHIRGSAERIVAREPEAIEYLMNALILIGITLSLLGSTRPGSGSEHHLSHFFEIVGLLRGEPHYCHGIDVGYSTVITAGMRERIAALDAPVFCEEPAARREESWRQVYGRIAGEVAALQESAGSYTRDLRPVYREKWSEIQALMRSCPTAAECRAMLLRASCDPDAFRKMYGAEKIRQAMLYGKDLKNRYSVLWLYYALFSGTSGAAAV